MIGTRGGAIGVGLAVTLYDMFSGPAGRVTRAMGSLTAAQRNAAVANQRIGGGMMLAAAATLVPMSRAINLAADFEYTMTGVKAITKATSAEFKELSKQAINLGKSSIFNAKEIADAQLLLAKTGFEAKDVYASMQGIVNMAAASDTPIDKVADFIGKIRNSFQIPAKEADRIGDIMTVATLKSSANLESLIQGFKYAGQRAAQLGIPLEEVTAMLAVLNSSGLTGSVAGVSIDNMLRNLSKAVTDFRTKRQTQALTAMGLAPSDIMDAQGNLKSLVDVVDVMFARMKGMNSLEQTAMMSALFGERGARGIVSAQQAGKLEGISFRQMTDMLKYQSAGEAKRIANERLDNLYGDLERAKEALTSMAIAIGLALSPLVRILSKAIVMFVDLVTALVSTNFGKYLLIAVTAFVTVIGLVGTYRFIVGSLSLVMGRNITAHSSFFTLSMRGWTLMTLSAARYATLLRGLNTMGLLSSMGLALNSAGRLMGPIGGGRYGFVGRGGIQAAARAANLMALATSGVLGPLRALAVGFIGLLGPIGGLLAFLGAIAAVGYGVYKVFKGISDQKEKDRIAQTPQGRYLAAAAAIQNQRVYDYVSGTFRTPTAEQINAQKDKAWREAFGAVGQREWVNPINKETVKIPEGKILINVEGVMKMVGRTEWEKAYKIKQP